MTLPGRPWSLVLLGMFSSSVRCARAPRVTPARLRSQHVCLSTVADRNAPAHISAHSIKSSAPFGDPLTVYFHRPASPPSTFYVLVTSSPTSHLPLSIATAPLSTGAYQSFLHSSSLLALITVDQSPTGSDPTKYPHPTVFLTTPTLSRALLRWPQAMDVIAQDMRLTAADEAYLRYALAWMHKWSRLPQLTPALSPFSAWHRVGLSFDPSRVLLAAALIAAATAYAASRQQKKREEKVSI